MPKTGHCALTFEQVHRIRTARMPDEYFAKLHGVCADSIGNARCGRTYKDHPTPPAPKMRPAKGKHSFGGAAPSDDIGLEPKDQFLYERLRAWVEVDADGCWIWTGAYLSNKHPAGQHGTATVPGRGTMGAHRAMWISLHGEVPEGQEILHTCDKPRCIHPKHLWAGTHAENMKDSREKGRHAMANKTHCKRNHPLPPPAIDGTRRCAECLRIAAREFQRRKRLALKETQQGNGEAKP